MDLYLDKRWGDRYRFVGEAGMSVTPLPCAICGSAVLQVFRRDLRSRRAAAPERFQVLRCRDCGTGFLSPPPKPDLLSRIYSDGYPSHAEAIAAGKWGRFLKVFCLFPYRLRFGREGGLFKPFGQGRLLDVGCGTGEYLAAMSRMSWRCSGCDISPSALQAARQRNPGADLHQGSLENSPWGAGSFEAVTLWHTLEHLPDPPRALSRVRDLLVPGGRLVIAIPNLDSAEARLLGARWLEIDIPGHLFFFSAPGLRALLEKSGFRVVRTRPQVHPSTVSDAAGLLLDDLLGIPVSRQRLWLYYGLFPLTAASYALGNWGCIEVTAARP